MTAMRGAFIVVDTLTALTQSGDLSEPLARASWRRKTFPCQRFDCGRTRRAAFAQTVFKSVAWRTPIWPCRVPGSALT